MVCPITHTRLISASLSLHHSHSTISSPQPLIRSQWRMSSRLFSAFTCLAAPSRYVASRAVFRSLVRSQRSRIGNLCAPALRSPPDSFPGKQSWRCAGARPRLTPSRPVSGRGRVSPQAAEGAAGATISSTIVSQGFFCDFSHQIVNNPSNVSRRSPPMANATLSTGKKNPSRMICSPAFLAMYSLESLHFNNHVQSIGNNIEKWIALENVISYVSDKKSAAKFASTIAT